MLAKDEVVIISQAILGYYKSWNKGEQNYQNKGVLLNKKNGKEFNVFNIRICCFSNT